MTAPYYEDDLTTLYLGDCRDVREWLTADVLVTDPPYGIKYNSGWSDARKIAGDNAVLIRDGALALWAERGPALVFGSWKMPRPSGVRNLVIWDKSPGIGSGMGDLAGAFGASHEEIYIFGRWLRGERKRLPSVIATSVGLGSLAKRTGHPTPKPLELMRTLVDYAPEGVIADPFAGSGATLVAAADLGRRSIGVELDEAYCERIAERLATAARDRAGAHSVTPTRGAAA